MRKLHVRYQEEDGIVSNRVMTGFVPFGDQSCSAQILGKDHMQPLTYDRILDAWDSETGVRISVRELCGAPPLPGPLTAVPKRKDRPRGKKRVAEAKFVKAQRRQDSNNFYFRYRHEVIWNHFRNKLLELFDGCCFACGSPECLQMDHHVPFSVGGRREPGNIVMLCDKCNVKKHDYLPEEFYSDDELCCLAPLLARESEVLAFRFDEERWKVGPYSYLCEIGVNPRLVKEVMENSLHPWAISSQEVYEYSINIAVRLT